MDAVPNISELIMLVGKEVVARATQTLIVSIFFVFVLGFAAFYAIRLAKKSLMEDNPDFGRFTAKAKEAELLSLVKRRKEKELSMASERAKEEERKRKLEEERESLLNAMLLQIGKDCPHCQNLLLEEDEIVICPKCKMSQHRVCYSLYGCINGCSTDFVVSYPEGQIERLKTGAENN